VVESVLIWLALNVPLWAFLWWLWRQTARDRRRWEVQQQVWEMERQIWDEQLPDEERERRRAAQARAAAVRREARRRLGLRDEEGEDG
jgi:hypothetical protein